MSTTHLERLRDLYDAFTERDLEAVLAAMAPDVVWPNGWEGGHLTGRDEVRGYWERQWAEVRLSVVPRAMRELPDGSIEVRVRQVARDLRGEVLARGEVCHRYEFAGQLVARMQVVPPR